MRTYRIVTTALSSLLLTGISASAFAGCFTGGVNCQAPTIAHAAASDALAPVHSYNQTPYGHLKRFEYKNTPNVNILRLHGRAPAASLTDHPSRFASNGCTTSSTTYCRTNHGPISAPIAAPMPAPFIAPLPAPVRPILKPYFNKNLPFVPGIAHVPTSIIDRSPVVYINGKAQPPALPVINGTALNHGTPAHGHIQAPGPHIGAGPVSGHAHNSDYAHNRSHGRHTVSHHRAHMAPIVKRARPVALRPAAMAPIAMPSRVSTNYATTSQVTSHNFGGANRLGQVVTNQYTYQPQGGGQYWEKTSGPTIVGGLPATQIICRRNAPRPAPVTVRVVRPVIGVPTPIPTPVPVPVCGTAPRPAPMPAPVCGPQGGFNGPSNVCNLAPVMGFGPRWTY